AARHLSTTPYPATLRRHTPLCPASILYRPPPPCPPSSLFFNAASPTHIYTLSLHDALPSFRYIFTTRCMVPFPVIRGSHRCRRYPGYCFSQNVPSSRQFSKALRSFFRLHLLSFGCGRFGIARPLLCRQCRLQRLFLTMYFASPSRLLWSKSRRSHLILPLSHRASTASRVRPAGWLMMT